MTDRTITIRDTTFRRNRKRYFRRAMEGTRVRVVDADGKERLSFVVPHDELKCDCCEGCHD
jgi:hypothetical protein